MHFVDLIVFNGIDSMDFNRFNALVSLIDLNGVDFNRFKGNE